MTIQKLLATYRNKSGLTQRQLAKKFNLHPQSVSNWERVSWTVPPRKVKKIAKAYGIPFDELADALVQERVARLRKNMGL